jgi:glutamate dehydrogenase/leucine dehydrogenase
VRHYYKIFRNTELEGKRAIIQGWGNVASAAACYLAVQGVKIVGIIDRAGGILSKTGLSLEQIKTLFTKKEKNQLVYDSLIPFEDINKEVWKQEAEIFIPGAASKLLTRTQIESLISGGLETIACGANVPFVDDDVFFGETAFYTDSQISLIPDFIANCGMARTFAYLMRPDAELTDKAIFGDVSNTIKKALQEVYEKQKSSQFIATTALEIALSKLLK